MTCKGCKELKRGLERQKKHNRELEQALGRSKGEKDRKIEYLDRQCRSANKGLSLWRNKYFTLKEFLVEALRSKWRERGYRFRIAELEEILNGH
jgi:predicted RNase H-like nuclease (RuvC/YqgF family)